MRAGFNKGRLRTLFLIALRRRSASLKASGWALTRRPRMRCGQRRFEQVFPDRGQSRTGLTVRVLVQLSPAGWRASRELYWFAAPDQAASVEVDFRLL
jgi:hypothetical protein